MVERLEWSLKQELLKNYRHYCPICERNKLVGHAADCELAALLKKVRGEMSKRTIENCRVIKRVIWQGEGSPQKEKLNSKVFCQGYQRSEKGDEPCEECKNCRLNIFYENQ